MSLNTSKLILKIFGIFSIICGVILIILGAMVFIGASQLSAGVSGMDICNHRRHRRCCRSFHGRLYGGFCFLADSQYRDIRCSKQDQEIQKLNPITSIEKKIA